MAIDQNPNPIKEEVKSDVQAVKDYYAGQEVKADSFLDDLKNSKVTALILFLVMVVVTSGAVKVLLFC